MRISFSNFAWAKNKMKLKDKKYPIWCRSMKDRSLSAGWRKEDAITNSDKFTWAWQHEREKKTWMRDGKKLNCDSDFINANFNRNRNRSCAMKYFWTREDENGFEIHERAIHFFGISQLKCNRFYGLQLEEHRSCSNCMPSNAVFIELIFWHDKHVIHIDVHKRARETESKKICSPNVSNGMCREVVTHSILAHKQVDDATYTNSAYDFIKSSQNIRIVWNFMSCTASQFYVHAKSSWNARK